MFIKHCFLLLLAVLLFLPVGLSGQNINRFHAVFQRNIDKYGKSDSTAGEVYYTPQKIILKITEPINQWIEVHQNETVLYYPDQRKGILLKSQEESFVNFINTFLASALEDYNLSNQDFSLYKNEFKGDTLYSYWKSGVTQIYFTLIHFEDRLVKVESRDEENNFITSVSFMDHIQFERRFYPTRMDFMQEYKGNKTVEWVTLSEIIFNKSFPEEINNFTIPQEVELKVIDW
jgi:hypothetical protein